MIEKIILLLTLLSMTIGSPMKCIENAPYNLNRGIVLLAIKDIIRDGMSWYPYRLGTLMDNTKSLPPSQVDAAVAHFMEVFCEPPYFEAFQGITNTGEIFTNRTFVQELYKQVALSPTTLIPFNDAVVNTLVTIPQSQSSHMAVYANSTAFFNLLTNQPGIDGSDILLLVNGWYKHKWRIDADGNICIAAFSESVRVVTILEHTSVVDLPWNLDI